MNSRTIVVIVLALVLGVTAAVTVHGIVIRPEITKPSDQVDVLVAVEEIEPGVQLTRQMVELKKFDKDKLPPHALTALDEIEGRAAIMKVFKDEPVISVRLSEPGKPIFVSLIKPGWRAYSVSVSDDARLGSFLTPRCRVDILLTLRNSGGENAQGPVTTTLLQNVEVLAVGNMISPVSDERGKGKPQPTRGTRNVTFMVEPEQAARLQLGSNMGTLHLVLRPFGETNFVDVRPVYSKDIIASEDANPDRPEENSLAMQRVSTLETSLRDLQEKLAALEKRPRKAIDNPNVREITLFIGNARETEHVNFEPKAQPAGQLPNQ